MINEIVYPKNTKQTKEEVAQLFKELKEERESEKLGEGEKKRK